MLWCMDFNASSMSESLAISLALEWKILQSFLFLWSKTDIVWTLNFWTHVAILLICFGSCVVFLIHDTILQQWISLLKNIASKEKTSCPCLLKNRGVNCWTIVPVTVEQSCQCLLNNRSSDSWIIMPVNIEESYQWLLKNRASDCWKTGLVTVEYSCQPLLKNRASDCWIYSHCWYTSIKAYNLSDYTKI